MALPLEAEPLPLLADAGGTIRIGGTRVPLETVVHAFDEGTSAEEIAFRFPTLELADVYATVTYYLQHPRAVQEYLERQETRGRAARLKIEASQPDRRTLRERLLARRSA